LWWWNGHTSPTSKCTLCAREASRIYIYIYSLKPPKMAISIFDLPSHRSVPTRFLHTPSAPKCKKSLKWALKIALKPPYCPSAASTASAASLCLHCFTAPVEGCWGLLRVVGGCWGLQVWVVCRGCPSCMEANLSVLVCI
jgi:hypothetical protein